MVEIVADYPPSLLAQRDAAAVLELGRYLDHSHLVVRNPSAGRGPMPSWLCGDLRDANAVARTQGNPAAATPNNRAAQL